MHIGSMSVGLGHGRMGQPTGVMPTGFNHQPHYPPSSIVTRFLPLDLSQPSAVYGLYAAAAAAGSAVPTHQLHHHHTGPILNPLLHPHFLGPTKSRCFSNEPDKTAEMLLFSKTSEGNINNSGHKTHVIRRVGEEEDCGRGNTKAKDTNGKKLVSRDSAGDSALLPRNNVVRIAKADYFSLPNNCGNTNNINQLVSSTCIDSDGSSNSSSSSSSSTSRITPPSKLQHVIVDNGSNNSSNSNGDRKEGNGMEHDGKSGETKIRGEKKRKGVVRDDAYWERRRKNNDAAKRSRDSRRRKEDEVAVRAAILEQENLRLRFEIDRLKSEVEKHRVIAFTAASTGTSVDTGGESNGAKLVDEVDVVEQEEPCVANGNTMKFIHQLPAPSPLKFGQSIGPM